MVNTKRRGEGGEQLALATIRAMGGEAVVPPIKTWRYFLDMQTQRPRLGKSMKDDGDFLDLFDMLAWLPDCSLRVQVKDWERVVAPPKKWRERVEDLVHPPQVVDAWWSKDPHVNAWWVYEYLPKGNVWCVYSMDFRGNPITAEQDYQPGSRRSSGK